MRSKTYQQTKASAPAEAVDLDTAIEFLKSNTRSSFDETIELHINLNIDASKSDQLVRGQVDLPSGSVKQQNIVVFTDDSTQQKAATEAGAAKVGGEALINEIAESGNLDADVTIATPDMMPKVAKIARILGPKGLMPNPKTNTVSDDPAQTVTEMQGGKVTFKMDQLGNMHQPVGKASWEAAKIAANTTAFIEAVRAARPPSVKGQLLKSLSIKSTMSPSVRVTV